MIYRNERWLIYAHRCAYVMGFIFTIAGALIVLLGFVMPFAEYERRWFGFILLVASVPLWLVGWLLTQAKTRDW